MDISLPEVFHDTHKCQKAFGALGRETFPYLKPRQRQLLILDVLRPSFQ